MERLIKDIIKAIKDERESRGLTQKELATLSGVSYSTLTKIEAGIIKNPSIEIIVKLAKELDISIDKLLQNK
jgi:transcriptional regulator with XRE-family HTH domain